MTPLALVCSMSSMLGSLIPVCVLIGCFQRDKTGFTCDLIVAGSCCGSPTNTSLQAAQSLNVVTISRVDRQHVTMQPAAIRSFVP